MTDNIGPRLARPEIPFLSEKEIEEQFSLFTARINDSSGNTYKVTVPLYVWDWFLMLTWSVCDVRSTMEDVLDWQEKNPSKQTLDESFAMYITELIRIGECDPESKEYISANHIRFINYKESDTHPYYDELIDLQWRFDNKVKYPVAPSPIGADPRILYE